MVINESTVKTSENSPNMTRGPLRRVYIGSDEYSSIRRPPKPILYAPRVLARRILVTTSIRLVRVYTREWRVTRHSSHTLVVVGYSGSHNSSKRSKCILT